GGRVASHTWSSAIPLLPRSTHSGITAGVSAWLQELQIIEHDLELRPFLPIRTSPLIQLQMAFQERLLALTKVLLHQVGKLASSPSGTATSRYINKDRLIFPLGSLRIFSPVIYREPEISDFSAR